MSTYDSCFFCSEDPDSWVPLFSLACFFAFFARARSRWLPPSWHTEGGVSEGERDQSTRDIC